MSAGPILFWLFAAMAVAGGLMAVLLPRIVHAVFSLMLSFVGVAAVYVLAGADFLAITQVVVYVGGVLVLIAFGILLTGRTADSVARNEARSRKVGLAIGLVLFFGLMRAISATSQFKVGENEVAEGTTEGLGKLLLGDYIIAFEFASILLLVALVGAAYLVRRPKA
jgi:NADH-quinone oxidoreductase subunit J